MNKLTALKGLYDAQVHMNGRLRAQIDLLVEILANIELDHEVTVGMVHRLNIGAQKNHDRDLATIEEQEKKLKEIFGEDLWKDD